MTPISQEQHSDWWMLIPLGIGIFFVSVVIFQLLLASLWAIRSKKFLYDRILPNGIVALLTLLVGILLVVGGHDKREEAVQGRIVGKDKSLDRRGARLQQQIVGTWTNEASGMMVIASDGRFTSRWPNHYRTNAYVGTWQIKDGVLISMVTNANSSEDNSPVGDVAGFKIINVDDHHLVYRFGGQTISLSR